MKIDKEHIVSYIPQRAPFIMIDNLIDAADGAFMTDFHVLPDNIFLEGDTLREFALIENIAQSSAAGISFMKSTSQSGSSDGFIGGISKLIVHALPETIADLKQHLFNGRLWPDFTEIPNPDHPYLRQWPPFIGLHHVRRAGDSR